MQPEPDGSDDVSMEQLRHTVPVISLQWSGADLLHGAPNLAMRTLTDLLRGVLEAEGRSTLYIPASDLQEVRLPEPQFLFHQLTCSTVALKDTMQQDIS